MRKLIVTFCLLLVASLGNAAEALPVSADPVLEARVQALSEELRCLVCQNQNLADSHAELAIDLKNQVRELLKSGRSEKEVAAYMVERYGDFVLYRPPLKMTTLLLWVGPFALLAGGLGVLFFNLRRRHRAAAQPLSQDERAAAARLLDIREGA